MPEEYNVVDVEDVPLFNQYTKSKFKINNKISNDSKVNLNTYLMDPEDNCLFFNELNQSIS